MSIKKIAKVAGVSTATVSRVLNGSVKVQQKTAERVLEVVDEMNYQLNNVARRMKVKASDSLIFGLIITDIGNPFFANVARGVEEVAFKNKHVMLICNTNESPEKEKFFLNSMLSEKVSGIIIVPTAGNDKYLNKLVSNGFPMVMVDRRHKNLNIDTVSINNESGAYQAVKRLINNGHKRIGIINGVKGLSNTEERFEGYKKALKEADIPISKELITYGNYIESGGWEAMRTILSLKEPPTAVFSTNNLMTLGCIKEIHLRNLLIPDDIALIGFDDSNWAEAMVPPLTTVKQPGYELGVNAAELLFKRLSNKNASTVNVVLNTELVIRESCKSKNLSMHST
ncbi:MAG: LacI family DNA-binding transcriptional regulator [Balneolales bacterium]